MPVFEINVNRRHPVNIRVTHLNLKDFTLAQDIRLKYFFLPVMLRMQPNPKGENVIILRPTFFGIYEFIRLPVHVAHELADLLELAAKNAASNPVVSGCLGEIHGNSVRSLGTAQMRIQLSVKRPDTVRFGIRQIVEGIGRKTHRSTPTLSVSEARRFANLLREANVV